MCEPGTCEDCCSTDEWIAPSGLTDLARVHDIDVTLGAGRMCGYGHPLRGSASAHGDWWCHPSCDCHPDCYRVATASMSGPLAPEQPTGVHAPALTVDGFTEALRALGRDGGEPECGLHRLPEGPCEDISQCSSCGMPTWAMRPAGECFGHHASDCSLSERHESFCVGGGSGHPTGLLRGWPEFTWTSR